MLVGDGKGHRAEDVAGDRWARPAAPAPGPASAYARPGDHRRLEQKGRALMACRICYPTVPDASAPTSELVAHHRAETAKQLAEMGAGAAPECAVPGCDGVCAHHVPAETATASEAVARYRAEKAACRACAAGVCSRHHSPPDICACQESDMYRALLERVVDMEWITCGPYHPASSPAALLADIREALSLRGSR